eukprot:scaffold1356_cov123-Cylindrotheca_fusiformis.AAC.40
MIPQAQDKEKKGVEGSTDLMEHDVVCEKGRGDHERWAGNQLYRFLINANKEDYNDLPPMQRSGIIGKIIDGIKEKDGWFVQRDESSRKWVMLSEEKVRKKVSDDLRREVRRRREKRTNKTAFIAKLKVLKESVSKKSQDVLRSVDDPNANDVLFGPGARRHPGNKNYWDLMQHNLEHYIISPYGARSIISRDIVQGIRNLNGRFLEQDPMTSIWYEISDKRAIEKTSHALSNKKYKTRKRDPVEAKTNLVTKEIDNGNDSGSTSKTANSSSSDAENQSRGKRSSKKSRLLNRMDDTPLDISPSDDIMNDRGVLLLTSLNTVGIKEVPPRPPTPPATPPVSGRKGLSMTTIITPNDASRGTSVSSVSDDSSSGDRSSTHSGDKNVPHIVDAPHLREFMYSKSGQETRSLMTPRFSRYMDEESYAQEAMIYKPHPASYRHHMEDYSSPPSYGHYAGRYIEPPSPHVAIDYHHSPKGHPSPYSPMPPRYAVRPSGYQWVKRPTHGHPERVEEYSSWH